MSSFRIASSALFLLLVFVLQETLIAQINLPIAGFSLYLFALIGLISLEDRSGALILGFLGGLILDLSPTTDSPVGQWAFTLTIAGYLLSTNKESIGDFTTRPLAFVLFVSAGVTFSLFVYLFIGLLLGENNGSLARLVSIVLGNAFWTILFSPVLLPILPRLRRLSLTSRERI